jgi:sugar (pentulose or hexulose) kinase
VGFEIRRCLDVLAETTPVHNVVVAGHLTERHTSLQMLADILNRPVQVYSGESPAAQGAALGALQLISLPLPARTRSAPVLPGGDYDGLYNNYLARTHAISLV